MSTTFFYFCYCCYPVLLYCIIRVTIYLCYPKIVYNTHTMPYIVIYILSNPFRAVSFLFQLSNIVTQLL